MAMALRERKTAPWLLLREAAGKKEALMKAEVLPVRQIVAPSSLPIGRLASRFTPRRYHLVLVVNENFAPVGSVSENQVMDALMQRGAMEPIANLLPLNRPSSIY
jgi:stage IV sporulation protein FB